MGFDCQSSLHQSHGNLSSTSSNSVVVDEYVEAGRHAGRFVGPILQSYIGGDRCSRGTALVGQPSMGSDPSQSYIAGMVPQRLMQSPFQSYSGTGPYMD